MFTICQSICVGLTMFCTYIHKKNYYLVSQFLPVIIAMEMETQNYNHNLLPKNHIAVFEFLVKMNLVPNVV